MRAIHSHLGSARKRRGFMGVPIAALCDGRLHPQSAGTGVRGTASSLLSRTTPGQGLCYSQKEKWGRVEHCHGIAAMARRERKKQEVSLFPFLDILACVIGNLILIITAVVLEQVDTKPMAEVVDREAKLQRVAEQERQIKTLEKELATLHASNRTNNAQLEQIELQIEAAEDRLEQARNMLARVPKNPLKVDPELVKNKALLAQKKRELDAAIAKVTAEIAERKKAPEKSIVLLPALRTPFQVHSLIPASGMFIEVNKKGLTIFPAKQFWQGDEAKEVPTKSMQGDKTLQSIMEAGLNDRNKIVVLLLRPDALDVYAAIKSQFDRFQQVHKDKLEQKVFDNPQSPLFNEELAPIRQRKLYSKIPLPGEGVLPLDSLSL